MNLHDFEEKATVWVNEHVQQKADLAIKSWKDRVASWLPTAKKVFAYIRNPLPAKTVVLCGESESVVDTPVELIKELHGSSCLLGQIRAMAGSAES